MSVHSIKKNPACRILRLRRVALATLFHSAAVRSLAERFLCHRGLFLVLAFCISQKTVDWYLKKTYLSLQCSLQKLKFSYPKLFYIYQKLIHINPTLTFFFIDNYLIFSLIFIFLQVIPSLHMSYCHIPYATKKTN